MIGNDAEYPGGVVMKRRPVLKQLRQDVHRHDRARLERWFTHLYLDGQNEKRCTAAHRCPACRVRWGLPDPP